MLKSVHLAEVHAVAFVLHNQLNMALLFENSWHLDVNFSGLFELMTMIVRIEEHVCVKYKPNPAYKCPFNVPKKTLCCIMKYIALLALLCNKILLLGVHATTFHQISKMNEVVHYTLILL